MKRRRVQQPERRRPLVEINLAGDTRPGSAVRRRGCASLLTRITVMALIAVQLWQGLN